MKKILIHTLFYQNYNYGGILQAYALYHTLERMGFKCEELNYTQIVNNKFLKLFYRAFRLMEILKNPSHYYKQKKKELEQSTLYNEYLERFEGDLIREVFEKFMDSEFKSTKVYHPDTIKNLSACYDYYIVGGDQVWNPDWSDSNMFLGFVSKGKKIGYSCSAGKSVFSESDKNKIKKYIKNIDVISVREENLSKILANNGIENQIVADPVFLMTKREWEEFSTEKYMLKDEYVFVYLLGEDAERRKCVKEFAQKNGLKIVTIPHVHRRINLFDEGFADVEIHDAGPREFVELIKNAKFVLTDSFHGTAFSILLEKQFLNFSRTSNADSRNMNIRLQSIVLEYGIEDRMINVDNLGQILLTDLNLIDYQRCITITNKKHDDAINFLKNNLEA